MARTGLTLITAGFLTVASIALMVTRWQVLGEDVKAPHGSWKITLVVQGESHGDARVVTSAPPEFGHQHVFQEACHSKELIAKLPAPRNPDRHSVVWTKKGGPGEGLFRAHYEFHCKIDIHRPTQTMLRGAASHYAPPGPNEYLELPPRSASDGLALANKAMEITQGKDRPGDQALSLYHFVEQEIADEPSLDGSTQSGLDCLKNGAGDAGGKSRLLLLLLRAKGISARLLSGLVLTKSLHEQLAHYWVEAWIDGQWLAYCPFYHHFEHVPSSYFVLGFGDGPVVRGKHVDSLRYKFLVERSDLGEEAPQSHTWIRKMFMRLSLYMLPPAEQRLVEFLLLLPLAALIVCFYRNVIGLASFGTFAPALIGLAFRDLHSMPGMLVFVSILLVGWVMRRSLNAFHLLQVPRTAVLLTLVVMVLIGAIVAANVGELPATRFVALFPMVILTGMIERFWTLENEDSAASSFKTLLSTLFIAASIAVIVGLRAVVIHLFRYPETLGLLMAIQLILGRYTGYRLMELYRFRDFLQALPPSVVYYSIKH